MRSCFKGSTYKNIKKKKIKIILISLIFLIVMSGMGMCIFLYLYLFRSNVITGDDKKDHTYIYISTGSGLYDVKKILSESVILKSNVTFQWAAQLKRYDQKVKPGKYKIINGMSNNSLINLLRSGRQEPVTVIFHNIRTREELAGKISRQIEADSLSIVNLLRSDKYMSHFGINSMNSLLLFIPNTYEFYWNTSAEMFINRMSQENRKFWNDTRMEKCRTAGLTWQQVAILASIVEKETYRDNEKPLIAGVYMNRLLKGWPLQADPTIIFAWNDYSIKRVLNMHIRIISPFNTYSHTGLPPGPICLPSISSIDAVLNFKRHNYMYFCAKDDLSGYHVFATTLAEHNRNAKKYQSAIKKLNLQ